MAPSATDQNQQPGSAATTSNMLNSGVSGGTSTVSQLRANDQGANLLPVSLPAQTATGQHSVTDTMASHTDSARRSHDRPNRGVAVPRMNL